MVSLNVNDEMSALEDDCVATCEATSVDVNGWLLAIVPSQLWLDSFSLLRLLRVLHTLNWLRNGGYGGSNNVPFVFLGNESNKDWFSRPIFKFNLRFSTFWLDEFSDCSWRLAFIFCAASSEAKNSSPIKYSYFIIKFYY